MRRYLSILIGLGVFSLLVIFGLSAGQIMPASALGESLQPTLTPNPAQLGSGITVGRSVRNDTSPPLRDIPPVHIRPQPEHEAPRVLSFPSTHVDAPDAALQSRPAPLAMPATILNFEGIPFPGVDCNCAPPDTNGEPGDTQYVQIVNRGIQVFDKANGHPVLPAPVSIETIWSGFGGFCEAGGFGDPVVLYDQLAGRWVVGQMAGPSITATDYCIAVSTTADATGSYHRYDLHLGSNFFDYPKLSAWPDAYYLAENAFNASLTQYLGPQPFALDRTAMLSGSPASFVSPGAQSTSLGFMLSADLDGSILPAAGAPNPWLSTAGDTWHLYRFHVDFANPQNTTFAPAPGSLTPASYTALCGIESQCIIVPQSEITYKLDGLGDRPMFRLAYRRLSDGHEALVGNRTVSSNGVAGIRWWEIANATVGIPAFVQQGTYAPADSTWRWMGSVAMDKESDLALGFSASGSSIHPQIRYAGRLANDTPGQLAQGEAHLFDGTGSQEFTNGRWGDYSELMVDPVDDCTFWYTNEYIPTNGSFNWRTRIGSFKFPTCASGPTPTPTNAPTPTSTLTPTPTKTFTPTATPATITLEDEDYRVQYDGWRGVKDSRARGGTVRVSGTTGDTVSFSFDGTYVEGVSYKGPAQGIAEVKIDDHLECDCDLYSPFGMPRFSHWFTGLESTGHTLVVTVTGNKNASANGTNVVVDDFVAGSTVQDDSVRIQYNTWQGVTQSAASGGSYRVSGTEGAVAKLTFTGDSINWITTTGPAFGMADVYIDGLKSGPTLDLYSVTNGWDVSKSFKILGGGQHTIEIRPLGTRNPKSSGTGVVVDAFRGPILVAASSIESGTVGVVE